MLVIFDCDGVLVDSETLAAEVFSAELSSQGISFSPEQCLQTFKGHTLAYCRQWIEDNFEIELVDGFMEELEISTRKAFQNRLTPCEGVEHVIEYLRDNAISYCVASNGGHNKVLNSLTVTGLLHYFPANRFSAEDVARGKPAPDLYLYAAEVMGVPPAFCLVVEDSVTGVRAGLEAGMRVLTYSPEKMDLTAIADCDISAVEHVASMRSLLDRLRAMR